MLDLYHDYRSSAHQIGRDLHARLLSSAVLYQRAVGFLSSTVFRVIPQEYQAFFANGGRMEIVCSERLSTSDLHALSRAIYERPQVRKWWPGLDEAFAIGNWSSLLGYLVARNYLRIRIALLKPPSSGHMYHEKIGVFRDEGDHMVAISGSANETAAGLLENFERVDVYRSWGADDERRRASRIEQQFRELWRNDTMGVEVIELAEAFRRGAMVASLGESETPSAWSSGRAAVIQHPEALVEPSDLKLFAHQTQAIASWGAAGGRGVLEMATGTGKTVTSLSLASRVYDRVGPGLAILIVAPLIHLVDQWREVSRRFALEPIRCAGSRREWHGALDSAIYALNSGRRPLLSIATTAATLAGEDFQLLLKRIRKPILVIADEVHNYGTSDLIRSMPIHATMRVGLSATPERWMDAEGTAALRAYFGDSVYRYGLEEAIRDEILTPYHYFPEVVDLDQDELEQYIDLTRMLARYVHGDPEEAVGDAAKRLLIRRARLLGAARQKLPLLRRILSSRTRDSHILVYCGDGSVEGKTGEEIARQISEVIRIVGHELGMRCAPYTAETPPQERQALLRDFAGGLLQVLVAIRCLDEGVDVPEARTAILLASSTNPRQFVQRRGRVLRRAPGKNRAEIIDVFVIPTIDEFLPGSREWEIARGMVGGQLRRAREFANLAENGPVARARLLETASRLNLLSAWEGN